MAGIGRTRRVGLAGLVTLLLGGGPAGADLMAGTCEPDAGGVAADIVELAEDTRASPIFLERDAVDPGLGIRLARPLDGRPGSRPASAASQLLRGDLDGALAWMDAYAVGLKKTPVMAGAEDHALGLIEDSFFLSGCILALR